jgi:anaerobic selenocysteine-containing dehydrogenase
LFSFPVLFGCLLACYNPSPNQDDYLIKRNPKDTPKLSKHGFLEQIKSKAAATAAASTANKRLEPESSSHKKAKSSTTNAATAGAGPAPQWNALKDDYLLNPKKVRVGFVYCGVGGGILFRVV